MVGIIAKILIALNSNSRPGEIASAIAFGFWLALIPGGNLLWPLLFIIVFFLKINTAAYFLSLGLFRILAPFTDSFLDRLGGIILSAAPLHGFFSALYNLPLVPFTKFNNTVVMGGFLTGLVLWLPLFFLFHLLIRLYRGKLAPLIMESRWMKGLRKIPFISKIGKAVKQEGRL